MPVGACDVDQPDAVEAQVMIEDWRQDYNQNRSHSALRMMTAAA
jgi:transposase InsO family protein